MGCTFFVATCVLTCKIAPFGYSPNVTELCTQKGLRVNVMCPENETEVDISPLLGLANISNAMTLIESEGQTKCCAMDNGALEEAESLFPTNSTKIQSNCSNLIEETSGNENEVSSAVPKSLSYLCLILLSSVLFTRNIYF